MEIAAPNTIVSAASAVIADSSSPAAASSVLFIGMPPFLRLKPLRRNYNRRRSRLGYEKELAGGLAALQHPVGFACFGKRELAEDRELQQSVAHPSEDLLRA